MAGSPLFCLLVQVGARHRIVGMTKPRTGSPERAEVGGRLRHTELRAREATARHTSHAGQSEQPTPRQASW